MATEEIVVVEEMEVVEEFPLHQAVGKKNNKERVRELITKAAHNKASLIRTKDHAGRTPLHYAAMYGQLDIADYLIKNSFIEGEEALIHIKDNAGCTPLHYAAMFDWLRMVQYLVEKGARIEDENNKRHTALYHAVVRGWSDIVVYLAENVPDLKDGTLLQAAIDEKNAEVVAFLIQKGARPEEGMNIHIRDAAGRTPLHFAARYHLSTAIKVLWDPVVARVKDNQGLTPLAYARRERSETGKRAKAHEVKREFDKLKSPEDDVKIVVAVPAEEQTEEERYFQNMKALKESADKPQLEVERRLYPIMQSFGALVQEAKFVRPQDKDKAYRWGNGEMERVFKPASYNEEAAQKLWSELSSEGEMGKVKPYLLGRTAAWASIGLGVALIVASGVSVGGTLGMSWPILLPTLWLSYTLISAGVAAIAGGTFAKNVTATPYQQARDVKEEWKGVGTGVKAAFWHPPEPTPPRRNGIGAADLIGGLCALMGSFGI